jgi:Big-like domain-containing protein
MGRLALPMLVRVGYSMATPFNPATTGRLHVLPVKPMSHSTSLAARSALVVFLAGAMGCASDVLLPDPVGGSEAPVALSKYDGDQQIGTVGEVLQSPLVVRVLSGDQPVAGRQVAFVLTQDPAAGIVSPDIATTNSEGMAVAHWTLGSVPGDHLVVAQLVGDTTTQVAEFRAQAKPGAPDILSPVSELSQPGRRKQPVKKPPVVLVVDRFGNPVPEASVAWQVTSGRGEVDASTTLTDTNGKATVAWTLGNGIGVQKLTAAIAGVTGSPITFTVTVLF